MRHISIRLRRGRLIHAIAETRGDPRVTFCGRVADGGVIASDVPDCMRCLKEIARQARPQR